MMIIEDWQFQALCHALEREDLAADPRYATLLMRIVNMVEIYGVLEGEIRKWPTAVLVERARAAGAPVTRANGVAEFLVDPQVVSNRTVFEADDPLAGRIRYLRNPVRAHKTPASLRRHAPRLGEHTDEVLRAAGYSDAAIAELRSTGVVA
jgi:crotonobetainyl-CoA:carnitine CoA-transferase CaiB-like acyl-CoA transferase